MDRENDEMVTCPFDPRHTMKLFRLHNHILSAHKEESQKSKEVLKCPYNARHVIKKHLYHEHCATCRDRGLLTASPYESTVEPGQTGDIRRTISMASDNYDPSVGDLNADNSEEYRKSHKINTRGGGRGRGSVAMSENQTLPGPGGDWMNKPRGAGTRRGVN